MRGAASITIQFIFSLSYDVIKLTRLCPLIFRRYRQITSRCLEISKKRICRVEPYDADISQIERDISDFHCSIAEYKCK